MADFSCVIEVDSLTNPSPAVEGATHAFVVKGAKRIKVTSKGLKLEEGHGYGATVTVEGWLDG